MDQPAKKGRIYTFSAPANTEELTKKKRTAYERLVRLNAPYYLVLRREDEQSVLCVPLTEKKIKHGVEIVIDGNKYYAGYLEFVMVMDAWLKLYHATGIRVSGYISGSAELLVTNGCEHENCIVCKYLEKLPASIVLSRYHIALTGGYYGLLYVQIPVDQAFEGQIVTIVYCDDGKLVTIQVEVKDGYASFFVDRLHTFVILDGQYHAVTEGGHQMLASDETGETVYVDGLFNTVA
ncbi:MAG: hypothetical protein Q4F81_04355 [Eubacteriales bacterium]|nr:hypothetical protein [Eubacteriales bacterium]